MRRREPAALLAAPGRLGVASQDVRLASFPVAAFVALAAGCQPAPGTPAALPLAAPVASPASSVPAPTPPSTSAASASATTPLAPPWTPPPVPSDVPVQLADTHRKLSTVGKVRVERSGTAVSLVCEECGPAAQRLTVDAPAMDGSYTAPGRRESVLVVGGDCAVLGRVWGCTVLLEQWDDGSWRWKAKADVRLNALRVVHLAQGRDILVGDFLGFQMGATWQEVFVLDFANEDPMESVLVLAHADLCTTGGEHASTGSIEGFVLEDRNKDGATDLVVSVSYGERTFPPAWLSCKPKPDGTLDLGFPLPVATPMRLVFLGNGSSFVPDAATKKLLSGKHALRRRAP